jgi:hypothetical protein
MRGKKLLEVIDYDDANTYLSLVDLLVQLEVVWNHTFNECRKEATQRIW